MVVGRKRHESRNFIDWLRKRLLLLTIVFVAAFMLVQFFILSTVGTMGPEISSVRREREQLKLDNELKQSMIREYQTNEVVMESVSNHLEMKPVGIRNLDASDKYETVTAIDIN